MLRGLLRILKVFSLECLIGLPRGYLLNFYIVSKIVLKVALGLIALAIRAVLAM